MHPILCEDESMLIAAEPKTGKTAVALTVGLHVACGFDLGTSLRVAEPRGVLYFGLEGRRAIRLRITAWRNKQSELGKVLPDFIPLFVVERGKNLLHENERQTLANAIKASADWMEKEHGIQLGAFSLIRILKQCPEGTRIQLRILPPFLTWLAEFEHLALSSSCIYSSQSKSRECTRVNQY